jgi:microcystin-dependent protein
MSQVFISQIITMACNFAPKGFALCNGQLLPINQNQALFSLLGTTYGGDGRVNFALPNLQGRAPMHMGSGHILGERGGEEVHTINQSELPTHSHTVSASTTAGSSPVPAGAVFGNAGMYTASPPDPAGSVANAGVITTVGGSQPHTNQQPYLVISYCIALQGIFPSQN